MSTKKQRDNRAHRRRQHQATTRSASRDPIPDIMADLQTLQKTGQIVEASRATIPQTNHIAIRVVIDTSNIRGVIRGLPVGTTEEIFLVIGDRYPDSPPTIYIDSDERFLGYPHVILGRILCAFLDPSREWHPTFGMAEVIHQTWEWFDSAANDRFDPRSSLFHAVGGVPPTTVGSPTVIVRSAPPSELSFISQATLIEKTPLRLDLIDWRQSQRAVGELSLPVFLVPSQLASGIKQNVVDVAKQIEQAGGCTVRDFCDTIIRTARTSRINTAIYISLIVTHPTEPDLPAVVVGRINSELADRLRAPDHDLLSTEVPIDWLPMSDERPNTTIRRDSTRPASNLRGSIVEVWGCGGLGSWIAELIVRTSPEKVILHDTGLVYRGHLVRQNYTELDVGGLKIEQLAKRLRAISEVTEIIIGSCNVLNEIKAGKLPQCDLVIDATINETVAYHLDKIAAHATQGPLLVQVATDIGSASLGIMVVAPADFPGGPATVDNRIADAILASADLEPYHSFWTPSVATNELNPAPGCSIPTYHGAAADLVAIAGSMVSIVGMHMRSPTAGIHMFAAPHSDIQPSYKFQPVDSATMT